MKKWGDMEENEPIRFFGSKSPFSNFADIPVTIGGLYYPTTEHYFQSMKFIKTDPKYAELIRKSKTPLESKKLGKSRDHPIDPKWGDDKNGEGNSVVFMRRALYNKAFQNKKFRDALIESGDRKLIEASPWDFYWGEGKNKKGKNMLGVLLMEVRTDFQKHKDNIMTLD